MNQLSDEQLFRLFKEDGDKKYDNLPNYNYSDIQYDVFKLVVENGKEDKKPFYIFVCNHSFSICRRKSVSIRNKPKVIGTRFFT